jgi:hypothetical protein
VTDATYEFWRGTLDRRFQLIDHIADKLLAREDTPPTGHALMSLTAARKRLADLTELACFSFVRAWRTDIDTWREHLTKLPVLGDLTSAAKYLDLPTLDRGVI